MITNTIKNKLMSEEDYELYNFLICYFKENGFAPSVREIGQGIHCAASMVAPKLLRLQRLGKIEVKQGVPRAIRLVEYEFRKVIA